MGRVVQAEMVDRGSEALPASALAPLQRKDGGGGPGAAHDAIVPDKAFADDLDRKLDLRKVMHPGQDEEAEPPAQQPKLEKTDVNYRYAPSPSRSCGECTHFRPPGACAIVIGLIRSVDTCDKYEAEASTMSPGLFGGTRVQAVLAESKPRRKGKREGLWDDDMSYDFGLDPFGDDADACDDEERDEQGRCPSDPEYDEYTAGLYFGENEMAPPGWSGSVKAMKGQPGIDNPFALAWSMKNKGDTPHVPPEKKERRTVQSYY